jgi:hypothetical protein
MTKFILVGGYIWKAKDGGQAFCRELVNGFTEPTNVLICNFAMPPEVWTEKFTADQQIINRYVPDRKIEYQLAGVDTFMAQLQWANAVFFKGGTTKSLIAALQTVPRWADHLEGKTVAGTSAGANMLSTYFHGLDNPGIHKGLGIVPVQVMVHYGANDKDMDIDWEKGAAELKNQHPELPVLALAEGEFRVVRI